MTDTTDLWEEQIKFNQGQVSNWNKQIEIDQNLLDALKQTRQVPNWNKQIEIDQNLLDALKQTRQVLWFLVGTVVALGIVLALRVAM